MPASVNAKYGMQFNEEEIGVMSEAIRGVIKQIQAGAGVGEALRSQANNAGTGLVQKGIGLLNTILPGAKDLIAIEEAAAAAATANANANSGRNSPQGFGGQDGDLFDSRFASSGLGSSSKKNSGKRRTASHRVTSSPKQITTVKGAGAAWGGVGIDALPGSPSASPGRHSVLSKSVSTGTPTGNRPRASSMIK